MNYEKFTRYTQRALATVYSEPENTYHADLIPEMVKTFFSPMDLPIHYYILDIGCGGGMFMTLMKDAGYVNVIGITLSEEDAEVSGIKGHTVIKTDMSDMPIPDNMVDFIWCRHALEHSPYPLFTLYEFDRVLKAGGKMYVELPCPDQPRLQEANPNHYSVLGNMMWVGLFEKAGFKVTQANTININLKIDGKEVPESYYCFMVEKNGGAKQG